MKPRRLRAIVFVALVGCVAAEVTSEISSEVGAGQGSSLQGSSLQGSSLQGSSLQGTVYDGASWRHMQLSPVTWGTSLTQYDATIVNGALMFWRPTGSNWERRSPDSICIFDSTRTKQLSCQTTNLASAASPIAGITFTAVFDDDEGNPFQARIRVGLSSSDRLAVARDTSSAMFNLDGASTCSSDAFGVNGCENPDGCRKNCDLWMYRIYLVDPAVNNGAPNEVCGGGQAIAVAGIYGGDGSYINGPRQSNAFTFACTAGTIAKCTRWGFRPWGSAYKSCQTSCSPTAPELTTAYPLVDLHQSCIRAAMADYCRDGKSYTRQNTLVDIYDYVHTEANAWGFVPKTRGGLIPGGSASAFVYESTFDKHGVMYVDHKRYEEVAEQNSGSGFAWVCPLEPCDPYECVGEKRLDDPAKKFDPASVLKIDSTTGCAHAESTVGKWLHDGCSTCAHKLQAWGYGWCTDPTSEVGWNADCVTAADFYCDTSWRMASHSECTPGSPLAKLATGCTFTVCSQMPSCCTSSWTAECVNTANATCFGGAEEGAFCGGGGAEM